MTATEQFAEITDRAQGAVTTAVRTWADSVQSVAAAFAGGTPKLLDPHSAVERYFDLAQQVLDNQRRVALTVLTASAQAAELLTEQVTRATESVADEAGKAAGKAAENSTRGPAAPAEPVAEPAAVKVRPSKNDVVKS
jgi:predicted RecB family nuclease